MVPITSLGDTRFNSTLNLHESYKTCDRLKHTDFDSKTNKQNSLLTGLSTSGVKSGTF